MVVNPLFVASLIFLPMSSAAFRLRCGLPPTHHLMAFASSSMTSPVRSHVLYHHLAFQWNGHSRYISKSCDKVNKVNRYDRFRACLRVAVSDNNFEATQRIHNTQVFSKDAADPLDVAKSTMEIMSSNRRSFNRTWERMNPLIQLILLPSKSSSNRMKSVADVGCDHGMLALSLACIAWVNQSRDDSNEFLFSKVFGTDLSSQALENGGIASFQRVNDALSKIGTANDNKSLLELPIQFRIGDGLSALQPGEANAIVIAGMGVHTMLDILVGKSEATTTPIESLQSEYIFLQPTNSRPQHLIILYDGLQKDLGWELCDEKVAFVGGRWYISSYFRRNDDYNRDSIGLYRFPGHYLLDNEIFDNYVRHHLEWLKQVVEKGPLAEEDTRWVNHILSLKDKNEWKMLAAWYNDEDTATE